MKEVLKEEELVITIMLDPVNSRQLQKIMSTTRLIFVIFSNHVLVHSTMDMWWHDEITFIQQILYIYIFIFF